MTTESGRPSSRQPLPRLDPSTIKLLMDLVPFYERTQHALGRQEDGVKQYLRGLRNFFTWLGPDATLQDFTHAAALDYRDSFGERGCANSTIINALAVLTSFSSWALERELISVDPMIGIERPPKRGPAPDPLAAWQVAVLLEAIREPAGLSLTESWMWRRNRRVVYLMLFAGLRRKEVLELRWERVLFEDQILDLKEGTKNGKPRRAAIHPDLDTELASAPAYERQPSFAVCGHPTGAKLTRGGIEHIFDRWLRQDLDLDNRLGVRLHPHKLRTTFATFFIWSGGNVLTLQKLLGHADVNTTNHYVLTDDEQKRREVRQLHFSRD